MTKDQRELPKTIDEAVNQLMSTLSVYDKRSIAKMSEDGLNSLHFSLGMYIRNDFGLWAGNNELIEECKRVESDPDLHIDSVSMVIIKALWERLKKFPPPKVVREGFTYDI